MAVSIHMSSVRTGRLLVNTTHRRSIRRFHTLFVHLFIFLVYYIYVVIPAWFREHVRRAHSDSKSCPRHWLSVWESLSDYLSDQSCRQLFYTSTPCCRHYCLVLCLARLLSIRSLLRHRPKAAHYIIQSRFLYTVHLNPVALCPPPAPSGWGCWIECK